MISLVSGRIREELRWSNEYVYGSIQPTRVPTNCDHIQQDYWQITEFLFADVGAVVLLLAS